MTVDVDPLLGQVRLCGWCLEWWPVDEEFYRGRSDLCRACVREQRLPKMRDATRRWRQRRRQATA